MTTFSGETVLITGAAGDIGQAAAVQFARAGARVAIFDRKLELLSQTIGLCRAEGAEVVGLAVDQTNRGAVDEGMEKVAAELGPVKRLFANAGYGKFARFLDQPTSEWNRHVDVNLTGTFNVCQAAARQMVAAKAGGSIVVNASSGAVQHSDLLSAYCATKAGLLMLAVGMASELGNHRIRVNTILPGVIETGMTSPMLAGADGSAHREVLLADTPVGRLGTPDDIAHAVLYLSSDEAAFVTGASIRIDGGQTIHGHPRWYRTDYQTSFDEAWEIGR
jgi:NAD(P)-dependent dehydrogenase (short-subunit alcohol dehydrogenase family)